LENSFAVAVLIFLFYFIKVVNRSLFLPKIEGAKGEYSVVRKLRKLNKNEYLTFNDVYLKANERSTQIDHLIISVYGIFVIETKNYSGWIHGSEKSEYWTQTFYKEKIKFRNPIKQNWSHIYFLKDVLTSYKQVKYHSIIVFTGKATLKNIFSQTPVIYKNKLIETIKDNNTPNLSIEQVNEISNQLSKFVLNNKKEHFKYVKRNIYEREKNIHLLICPNCGGELIIRNGKYGKFYGCSNYPGCRFTKNIDF